MKEPNYKYSAFISYRHVEPDMTIAQNLHTLIETYKIPKSVRKDQAQTKMGIVFRDQEELPLSSDLGKDITTALAQSEWLIVICSPQLLKSKWCLREIETFIELGKKDKILTVLVSGTPQESFPPQLRFDTTDGQLVEKEPLAANVVAPNISEMVRRLKEEKLRILAPMLGVSYDTLHQRSRIRKLKIVFSVSILVSCLLLLFSFYALTQNNRITAQRNDALISQSKYLADASLEQLNKGNKTLATLLALEALPESTSNPDRPLISEAKTALYSSIVSGFGSEQYQGVNRIETGYLSGYQSDGTKVAIYANDTITQYDLTTGKQLETTTCDNGTKKVWFNSAFKAFIFSDNNIVIPTNDAQSTIEVPYRNNTDEWSGVSDKYSYLLYNTSGAVYSQFQIYNRKLRQYSAIADAAAVKEHDGLYIIAHYAEVDQDSVILVDSNSNAEDNILHRYHFTTEDLNSVLTIGNKAYPGIHEVDTSYDGKIIMGMSSSYLYFWDLNTEQLVHILGNEGFDGSGFDHAVMCNTNKPLIAIVTYNKNVYLYDYEQGIITQKLNSELPILTSAQWNSDSSEILCATSENKAMIFSVTTGELIQTLASEDPIDEAKYAHTNEYGEAISDSSIILKANNALSVYQLQTTQTDNPICVKIGGLDLSDWNVSNGITLANDGNSIWAPVNYYSENKALRVYDTKTGQIVKELADSSLQLYPLGNSQILACNSTSEDTNSYSVYDTKTFEKIKTLTPEFEHVFTYSTGKSVDRTYLNPFSSPQTSPLGNLVLFNGTQSLSNTSEVNSYVFVYDLNTWEELWHYGVYDPLAENEKLFEFAKDWTGTIRMKSIFSDDGSKVITYYTYGLTNHVAVEIREAKTGKVITSFPIINAELTFNLTKHTNQNYIIQLDQPRMIKVYDLISGKVAYSYQTDKDILSLTINDQNLITIIFKGTTNQEYDPTAVCWQIETNTTSQIAAKEVFYPSTDKHFIFQGIEITYDKNGIYNAQTNKTILYLSIDKIIGTSNDGNTLLLSQKSGSNTIPVVLKNVDTQDLIDYAKDNLNGRQLNETEKITYYLD